MTGDIQGIHHVGLTISDMDRSLSFYCGLLGCELVMRQEKEGGYLAEIVGYPDASVESAHIRHPDSAILIELTEYRSPRGGRVKLEPSQLGNAHLCFLVADLDSVYSRLQAENVQFISRPVPIDTGVNTGGFGLYFRDPDGITLELFQRPDPASA